MSYNKLFKPQEDQTIPMDYHVLIQAGNARASGWFEFGGGPKGADPDGKYGFFRYLLLARPHWVDAHYDLMTQNS